MLIHDPIHGYIELNDVFAKIIRTKEFQRLLRVKQLGLSNLVFPSTNHTRFEHSLGAYYLAGRFAKHLDLDKKQTKEVKAAALLHDIGHGPYSHVSEIILEKENKKHEDISIEKILSDPIKSLLREANIDPDKVVSLINGKGTLGDIIAGDIDVDRMDYLMRDAHYSGVAHGTIDSETIIRAAEIKGDEIVFSSKFLSALEGLLVSRHLMYSTLYLNSTIVIGEKMMEKAMRNIVEEEKITLEEFSQMDDINLKHKLRTTENETAHYLNKRIDNRNLFKQALEIKLDNNKIAKIEDNLGEEAKIEAKIANQTDLENKKVVVNIIKTKAKDINVKIKQNDEIQPLRQVSNITETLSQFPSQQTCIRVYCPKENKDIVKETSSEILSV